MIRVLKAAWLKVWAAADYLYRLIPVEFLCAHAWKITSVQEEGEACRFLVHMQCKKCGAIAEHRRP